MAKYCHHCGAGLPAAARFCVECGIAAAVASEPASNAPHQEAPKTIGDVDRLQHVTAPQATTPPAGIPRDAMRAQKLAEFRELLARELSLGPKQNEYKVALFRGVIERMETTDWIPGDGAASPWTPSASTGAQKAAPRNPQDGAKKGGAGDRAAGAFGCLIILGVLWLAGSALLWLLGLLGGEGSGGSGGGNSSWTSTYEACLASQKREMGVITENDKAICRSAADSVAERP